MLQELFSRRPFKKAQMQGGARCEVRGVLWPYVAAPRECANAADAPFSAASPRWGKRLRMPLGTLPGRRSARRFRPPPCTPSANSRSNPRSVRSGSPREWPHHHLLTVRAQLQQHAEPPRGRDGLENDSHDLPAPAAPVAPEGFLWCQLDLRTIFSGWMVRSIAVL